MNPIGSEIALYSRVSALVCGFEGGRGYAAVEEMSCPMQWRSRIEVTSEMASREPSVEAGSYRWSHGAGSRRT